MGADDFLHGTTEGKFWPFRTYTGLIRTRICNSDIPFGFGWASAALRPGFISLLVSIINVLFTNTYNARVWHS